MDMWQIWIISCESGLSESRRYVSLPSIGKRIRRASSNISFPITASNTPSSPTLLKNSLAAAFLPSQVYLSTTSFFFLTTNVCGECLFIVSISTIFETLRLAKLPRSTPIAAKPAPANAGKMRQFLEDSHSVSGTPGNRSSLFSHLVLTPSPSPVFRPEPSRHIPDGHLFRRDWVRQFCDHEDECDLAQYRPLPHHAPPTLLNERLHQSPGCLGRRWIPSYSSFTAARHQDLRNMSPSLRHLATPPHYSTGPGHSTLHGDSLESQGPPFMRKPIATFWPWGALSPGAQTRLRCLPGRSLLDNWILLGAQLELRNWGSLVAGGTAFGTDPKFGALSQLPDILAPLPGAISPLFKARAGVYERSIMNHGGSQGPFKIQHCALSNSTATIMVTPKPRLPIGPLTALLTLLILSHFFTPVSADGRGMLGLGKYLYKPFCAHACRIPIQSSKLTCDSKLPGGNATSSTSEHTHTKRSHTHEVLNTPECYLQDAAFLRTLALCIAERCPRDGVSIAVIEEYWEGHIAAGAVGDWSQRPIMSYQDALAYAHEDVERVGEGNVPYVQPGEPLNATSLIRDEDWLPGYNANKYFERNERDHGRNALSAAITSLFIPVLLSLFRLLPGRPLWYSRLVALLEKPLIGHRHRTPIIGDIGIMPTRGQSLYLLYLLTTQLFLSIFPLIWIYPNSSAPTLIRHRLLVIGDRSAVISMADFVALFLFSSRNNILLWVTDWSHTTFLLLHRWIAYCLILEVSIHSLFLFLLHLLYLKDHPVEGKQPYWIWGIIGTFAFIFLWPASLLPIRKKAYEFFLLFHQVFAALALIATWLHIYYLYTFDWGYEIWVYVGGGLWFLDRVIRLLRMASNGYRKAVVSAIDDDAEYLKVQIDGVAAEGHVYLYFPTLSWKFWENHPYSVLSTFTTGSRREAVDQEKVSISGDSTPSDAEHSSAIRPHTTLLVRTMDGLTKGLRARLLASSARRISLSVIVESSYHANPARITAVLPIMKSFSGVRSRLEWGVRTESLVLALESELAALTRGLKTTTVNTIVGQRLRVAEIVKEELEKEGDTGNLGVVVCGPNSMADDVRAAVAEYGVKAKRGVVLVDEAFSW
ncbi:hypothetical protein NMY22_g7616 [Coprinellus aureogranulatus]|nr:hypothetical protein NMY22_g7616 [Coprinellus aureogranulatus]